MIRFRNPGTQYSTQVQVIKQLYENLGTQQYFTLEDMAIVIAQGKLMTAYGYAGDDALRLSKTDQESMNSALMNAKMYAEVFRMLGWITPYGEKSYPVVFTYIGAHVALSQGDCSRLYEQCVFGINNPNDLTNKMTYDEKVRFFKVALRSFIDLGGVMYKHELCLGPMSIDDQDEKQYQSMLQRIKTLRGNQQRLKDAFSDLAKSLGMKETPVDNCTRLPIGLLKSCGLVESVTTSALYGKKMECLQITDHGRQMYESLKHMKDLRLDEFKRYDRETQKALIRLGVYSMLQRSGYDMSPVADQMELDIQKCSRILNGQELLFSPYQTIKRHLIEEALQINHRGTTASTRTLDMYKSTVSDREAVGNISYLSLNVKNHIVASVLNQPEDIAFLELVDKKLAEKRSSKQIVDYLFNYYVTATQTVFYPLVSTLFKIIGFDCSFSRPGDNGARWDAIIDDPRRSIPIEIKSPTEEQHISIKAIRQALENKIILLSRKTHVTEPDVTSLAVGYYLPNDRAEVSRLISDIKVTYGYKIGVIDLYSLLSMAISVLVDGKGIEKELLFSLEGLINANI